MLAFAKHCASFVRYYGIVASLREIRPLIRELLYKTEERAERADGFDGRHGTDTSGMVMPWELKDRRNEPADGNPYASLTSDRIRTLIAAAPVVAGETVFVDLGSGKGRVLLVAQEFPFSRIVGVEWSSELTAIARSNLAVAAGADAPDDRFVLLQMDAGAYEFPLAPLVLFLFNPFGDETMARVVAGLERSLVAYPRSIFVIYANPLHAALFALSPAFRRTGGGSAEAFFEGICR
jgi:SAM-dependent methyltransferase